ncbi:hypothetical protein RhiJN_15853 [Ceratobasidium sp. AG-Ba]|nr:hypothetical protein RhiJN_15853 [Ceratobasidium sp. AG-Ba]
MANSTPPTSHIPFEIIVAILKLTLAAPISMPPSITDRKLRVSILQTSHGIRQYFIKDIYHIVILWSMDDVRKFANALSTSPHLGPLVHKLWLGTCEIKPIKEKGEDLVKKEYEDVFLQTERILSVMPNLRRLYIAIDAKGYGGLFQYRLPDSVQQLTLPSSWLGRTPQIAGSSGRPGWELPSSLISIRVRGSPQARDMIPIRCASAKPSQIIIETFDPREDFSEIGAWLNGVIFLEDDWKPLIKIAAPPSILKAQSASWIVLGDLMDFLVIWRESVLYVNP